MTRTALAILAASTAVAHGACGGGSRPPPTAHDVTVVASIAAPPASPDDVVVAEVNGRPVWGSCVTAQARRASADVPPLDRRAALDECIAFELLAQAAEARGLGARPEVQEAARTAMVSELVATFEASHATPADLGASLTRVLDANARRLNRPELRASTYVRVNVPAGAPPADDAKARRTIERVAAALAGEAGLLGPHVADLAHRVATPADPPVVIEDVGAKPAPALEPSYAGALFAIPEVGRSSPPVRTPWGWDVITWTGVQPARVQTRAELAQELFPRLRRQAFTVWVNQMIRDRRVQIAVDDRQLEDAAP